MANAVAGSVVIKTQLDNGGLKDGLKETKKDLGGLQSAVKQLRTTIAAAFAVRELVNFGKEAIELGSNVQEVQNVVDMAFVDMADKVEAFAETSIGRFGMSRLAAKKTASTYMAMAKGMGVQEEAAADMAVTLAGLTGDVASFYNISQELADTKLKSVFTGETESLKELGIVMTQANLKAYALSQGITKKIEAMSQSELVALRYGYVMRSLSLAQGDFARTSDSWANQTRILSMQWQEFMSIIGQSLITVLTPAVKLLNELVALLIRGATAINTVISSLFGQQQTNAAAVTSEITAGVDAQNDLTAATEGTAKAQKKMLAGFDTINKLGSESAAGSAAGGGTGVSLPSIPAMNGGGTGEMAQSESMLSKIAEWVKIISAGLAGWKIGSALGLDLKQTLGLIMAIYSGIQFCEAIFDAWNNGVDTKNLTKALLSLIGLAGGLYLAFGQTAAGIALIVGGIALLVTGFKDIIENGANLQNTLMVIGGIIAAGLGISLLIGSLFPALVAGIMAIVAWIVYWQGGMDELAAGIKTALTGVINFIKHFFLFEWGKLWEDAKLVFEGLWQAIKAVFVSVLNFFIDGINWVVRKINSIDISFPDWVPGLGGESWSPSISTIPKLDIPRLATGAVIPPNREFLAVLGDQRSGTNIETPLATMVQAFRMALVESGGSGQQEAYLVLDEEVLGKIIYRLNKRETKRVGVSLVGGTL